MPDNLPTTATRPRLHLIGNAHLDVVWLWQAAEGLQEVRSTFRSALDRLAEYPEFTFTASSAAYYEWIERADPGMFEEIRARVAEGRWNLAGGWWVEPDCNLPAGESLARQALLGQRYFQSRFGRAARTGYNVDSFGHPASLPQILSRAGLDSYLFMRPMPNECTLPARVFWWESDDGSRVLACRLPYEYNSGPAEIEPHVRRCLGEVREPLREMVCLYGVGNHGGGPTRANLDALRRLQEELPDAELVFSDADRFFDEVREREVFLPTVHHELQHHASGCYSAHSGVKAWNRRAENALLAAEKFSTLAARLTGLAYPAAELERAWKNVLFNQFHDILAGTSIEPAYEEARDALGEATAIAQRATVAALQAVAWRIGIPEGGTPVAVFNPHPWPVRAGVELESDGLGGAVRLATPDGGEVPVQHVASLATAGGRSRIAFVAELPALGYAVYRALPGGEAEAAPIAEQAAIENERWRLEVDPRNGFVTSLLDKRERLEVLARPGGRPVVVADPSDTWAHGVLSFQDEVGLFLASSVRVVEHGPVKSVLRVESSYGASRLTQDFTLHRGLDGIEVRVTLDWRERQKALKLRWPVDLEFRTCTYEIPFGTIERPLNGEEEPGGAWVDLSGINPDTKRSYGLSLLNDAKHSYDARGKELSLTVLRSPVYAHHDPVRPAPEELEQLSVTDQGLQRFTYVLLPHSGGWREAGTARAAMELNQRPVAVIDTFHKGELPLRASFLEVSPQSVLVTALKASEDDPGDAVVRLQETSGSATRARLELRAWGRAVEVELGPNQVRSFRIPRDPAEPEREVNLVEWEV